MNLLSRPSVEKLDKTEVNVRWERGKVTVSAGLLGCGKLRFPLNFKPFSVLSCSWVAKQFGLEQSSAVINVEYYRRGKPFGERTGGYLVDKDNYVESKALFFVPFGVDEAYLSLTFSGGASATFFSLEVDSRSFDEPLTAVADGGLSAFAPKNTVSAILAAQKAGFKAIALDVMQTADGALICCDQPVLRDGEREIKVEESDFSEVSAVNVGARFNDFYSGSVILLSAALGKCRETNMTPYLRLKGKASVEKVAEEILNSGTDEYYIAISDSASAKKIMQALPSSRFAYFAEGDEPAPSDEAENITVLRPVNTPKRLKSRPIDDNEKIFTEVYLV